MGAKAVSLQENQTMLHRYARHVATLIAVLLVIAALLVALLRG